MAQQRLSQASRLKLRMAMREFQQKIAEETEFMINEVSNKWNKHLSVFGTKAKEIDDYYDNMHLKLSKMVTVLSAKLGEIQSRNEILERRIEEETQKRVKMLGNMKSNDVEVQAEVDLELQLQTKAVELARRNGEVKRAIENTKAKAIAHKKAYVRVLNEYKQIKEDLAKEKRRKRVEAKKAILMERKEEAMKMEVEDEVKDTTIEDRYLELLAAAGHKNPPLKSGLKILTDELPEANTEDKIVPIQRVGAIEKNIQTLLSTGNYSEDDPTIRYLRQMAKL